VSRSRPELLLMVYPLWATVAAMSFLAHATEAGMYYVVAGVLFCVAILMALTPTWAPLEVAFFMSGNMTMQALYLRRLSEETRLKSPIVPAAGSTTVKSEH